MGLKTFGRDRWLAGLWVLVSLMGCQSNPELVVDLQTDFVPGREFESVRVLVERDGSAIDSTTVGVTANQTFARGARLAELNVTEGNAQLFVRLLDGRGARVAERLVVVAIEKERTGVTAVVTRDCLDVICEETGLNACAGGRCVDPWCAPEYPEFCPEPQCERDDECPDYTECAPGICSSGICLADPSAIRCDERSWCDPDDGCTSIRDVLEDAGLGDVDVGDISLPDTAY